MITERIRIRKHEKEELERQLAKEELKFQGFDYSQIRAYLYHIKNLPGDDMEKKRALINIFINRIYPYDDHYTLILNGGNRGVELENIPLEVLDSSAFNGISEHIRCSPLVADAPLQHFLRFRKGFILLKITEPSNPITNYFVVHGFTLSQWLHFQLKPFKDTGNGPLLPRQFIKGALQKRALLPCLNF